MPIWFNDAPQRRVTVGDAHTYYQSEWVRQSVPFVYLYQQGGSAVSAPDTGTL